MQKVQILITDDHADMLKLQAAKQGIHLSKYIGRIVADVVEKRTAKKEIVMPVDDGTIPTFTPSKRTERALLQAEKEYREGKTRVIKSFAELDTDA